jgi:3-(3-hydroxy-phenyl)propionate hydroxylase
LGNGFLLDQLGPDFTILSIGAGLEGTCDVAGQILRVVAVTEDEAKGPIAERYLGEAASAVYLIRPDQHVVGRWPSVDVAKIAVALDRATGRVAHAA